MVMNNVVSASTTGPVTLHQTATAGAGGGGRGTGGSAASTLTLNDPVAASLTVNLTAEAGNGGTGALASGTVSGAHFVRVNTIANAKGINLPSDATSVAHAVSLSGPAYGYAQAFGSGLFAEGSATTAGGMVARAKAGGSATGRSTVQTWYSATVGQPAPIKSSVSGFESVAILASTPSAADALAALAGNDAVHRDVNVAGEGAGPASDVLAWAVLGGSHSSGGSAPEGQTSYLIESVDTAQLAGVHQHLLVGFLQPTLTGAGFDALHFSITREGLTVADESFADAAAALAYFTDRTLDLGPIDAGVTGPLDLEFHVDVTAKVGGGFTASLLVANGTVGAGPVPEPAGLLPVLAGLTLGRRRRRRARVAPTAAATSRAP
jgi:hypothetical protein